jgi:hypothetical protein
LWKLLERQPLFADFIDSRRTEATRRAYASMVRTMLGSDPEAFVAGARENRKSAKGEMMKKLVGMRGRLSPPSVTGMLSSLK